MSLFSKVNVRLILIAMVFALAPAATYAAAYIKFDGLSAKKMPRMRVTDKTTVHEVAVFAARHANVEVDSISLSWRGQELWGQRRSEGKRLLINHFWTTSDAADTATERYSKSYRFALEQPGETPVVIQVHGQVREGWYADRLN